jgi:DNA repair protein RadA/Sms
MNEMDRVLGGGIVVGSVVLVGGDPGIGKSTLLTQIGYNVASQADGTSPVLYVTGEESPRQVRLRCERLHAVTDRLLVVGETDLGAIVHHIASVKPSLAVIDSIQTTFDSSLDSAPGTVSQVRNAATALAALARAEGTCVFLIGHVTKEGVIAGPRVLEHMVDTVLYVEGDRHQAYRVLRAVKNRFGPTDELGLFEMADDGLHEVTNPSAAFLAERLTGASGSAVAATIEGTRPLLVEVQALVTRSFLTSPRRVIN